MHLEVSGLAQVIKDVHLLDLAYLWTRLCPVTMGQPRKHNRFSGSQKKQILESWILFLLEV